MGREILDLPAPPADARIRWLGPCAHDVVVASMQEAGVLVYPSLAFENCPLTVVEAFACGLPVVATGHGSIAELVPARAGLLTPPGDAESLAAAVLRITQDTRLRAALRAGARETFLARHAPGVHYARLLDVLTRAARPGTNV